MSDSEYDSEEDEDYVPEEPVSEEEELGFGEDDANGKRTKKKKEQGKALKRKKKGGIRLEGEEPDDLSNDEECEEPCEDLDNQEKPKQEELSKSRVNDLWAAFKRDTAVVRPSARNLLSSKKDSSTESVNHKDLNNKPMNTPQTSVTPKAVPKKVEITEIFDFAGEEVKVVKTVDASSLKAASKNDEKSETEDSNNAKPNPAVSLKRPSGGLGSVLGKIGKKPKLSTLEKSQLDWHQFKKQEGIEDDLKTSNRDGYLEKQAFLNRVDHKQFEIERDVRQGVRKR